MWGSLLLASCLTSCKTWSNSFLKSPNSWGSIILDGSSKNRFSCFRGISLSFFGFGALILLNNLIILLLNNLFFYLCDFWFCFRIFFFGLFYFLFILFLFTFVFINFFSIFINFWGELGMGYGGWDGCSSGRKFVLYLTTNFRFLIVIWWAKRNNNLYK